MNKIINVNNAANYNWGKNAKAFELCDSNNLSVKFEVLPPKETEILHFHNTAIQVFFVLNGKAKFIIDEIVFELHKDDSITVYSGQMHLIENDGINDLHLLVISNPNTKNDRINVVDI